MQDGRRPAALAVFLLTPASLLVLWLVRTRPQHTNCADDYAPGRAAVVADWLAGARPLLALGALVVLGMLYRVSGWRNASRPGGPPRAGTATRVAVALLAVYAVLCALDTRWFVIVGLPLLIALVLFWITIPLGIALNAWWVARRPAGERVWAAIQAAGWWSLLAGVGGVALMVAHPVTRGLCLS